MKHVPEMTYNDQMWAWADEHGQTDKYEGLEIYWLMVKTGEWLELIAGEDEANVAMIALYKALLAWHPDTDKQSEEYDRVDSQKNSGWRALWLTEEGDYPYAFTAGDLELIPTAQRFTALHAFAFGGVAINRNEAPKEEELDQVRLEIAEFVKWGNDFLETIPAGWPIGDHILETIHAANARYKLDELKEDVTVDELAALGKTGSKNIRNILAKKDGTLVYEEGAITLESAKAWLSKRSHFFPSAYTRCDGSGGETAAAEMVEEVFEDVVFVPVSKTGGEPFTPALRRGETFTIGPKGAEIHIANYFEALEQLKRMRTPKWRRPNAKGIWGLVSGSDENWHRMSRCELEKMDTSS